MSYGGHYVLRPGSRPLEYRESYDAGPSIQWWVLPPLAPVLLSEFRPPDPLSIAGETIVLVRETVAWRDPRDNRFIPYRKVYVYVAASDRAAFNESLLFLQFAIDFVTWIWNAVPQLWMRTAADLMATEDD